MPPTRGAISTLLEDLYTKPQTCCRCESVHFAVPAVAENPLELRRLLPAPGGLCATGSEIPATVPKLAFPRTLLPSHESMHPSWSSGAYGLRQSFDEAAMRKHPEVHAVHGTRDSSHSCSGRMCYNPGCNTAESTTLSPSSLWNTLNWTDLPCLKRRREDNWPRLDLARGGIHLHAISREAGFHPTRSHERQGLIPHAISREAGSHSRRDSKWINSESMWLISVSRDRAKISQSSR